MSNTNSFLLIPNHSIVITGKDAKIESAEAEMLNVVGTRFHQIGVASVVTSETISSLAGVISSSNIKIHRLNFFEHSYSRAGKIFNYTMATFKMPFIINRYDFIYIFCPGYVSLLASLWARLLGKKYGIYVRGTWLDKKSNSPFLWRWAFSKASFMIVTGESFKRRLLKFCDNVVNEVPLTALRPSQVEPATISVSATQKLVFAGRLFESKGVLDVVRALGILRREGRNVELMIAGGGVKDEIVALESLKAELGLNDSVTILGHIPPAQLAEAYRSANVFVFPSYYAEGFPRVLYEAMMYSLAIVTCEMPGTEGYLIDGENCLYTAPSDPVRLAECIRRVLDDLNMRERLGRNARQDVERLYASFIDQSHPQQLLRFLSKDFDYID